MTPTDLFAHYVEILDEGPLEVWPTFFTEHATYKIVARENQIRPASRSPDAVRAGR